MTTSPEEYVVPPEETADARTRRQQEAAQSAALAEAFGGDGTAVRIANALIRTGIPDLTTLNALLKTEGEQGLRRRLLAIRNLGEHGLRRIARGLTAHRQAAHDRLVAQGALTEPLPPERLTVTLEKPARRGA